MSEPSQIQLHDLLLINPQSEKISLAPDIPTALRATRGRVAVHVTLGGARRGKSLINTILTRHVAGHSDSDRFKTSDDPSAPCTFGAQAMLVQREEDCVVLVDAEGQNLGDERGHERLFSILMLFATNVTVISKESAISVCFPILGP